MNPLDQLKDIHLPPEIGLWPPAYGWWILATLFISLLVASFMWLSKRRRTRLAKRQALNELDAIKEGEQDWPQQLNRLLKRLAITYFPQTAIAKLHDRSWAEFLGAQLPAKKRPEFLQQFLLLQRGLYRNKPDTPADYVQCMLQSRQWIKHAIPPKQLPSEHASSVSGEKAQGGEHV